VSNLSIQRTRSGIALLTSLVTGVILVILGLALVGLYFSDFAAYRHQQRSVQAYWNARSGAERYALERTVPPNGLIKLAAGECHIEKLASGDIRCTGQFEGVKREIVVIGGRINHRTELP
jgi:Tfp pilus assembly protein PilV